MNVEAIFSLLDVVHRLSFQGRTQRGFEGRGGQQIQLGFGGGGAVSPPVGSGAQDFEINAFQGLRTPVSLNFFSKCCYTKLHAIFFILGHPHHFQVKEVVPNHTL